MGDKMKDLERECLANGWTIEPTRNCRTRWTSPEGEVVIASKSSGDARAFKNHLALLKRCACPPTARYN